MVPSRQPQPTEQPPEDGVPALASGSSIQYDAQTPAGVAPDVVVQGRGRGRWFLLAGMLGEAINLTSLLANNLVAPRWLPVATFGIYVRILTPAFVALGLIDAPQALKMFVVNELSITRLALRKLFATAVVSGLLAVGFGLRGWSIVASMMAGAAYSSVTAASHLGLRRGVWYIAPLASGGVLAVTLVIFHVASENSYAGLVVAMTQSALVLTVGAATFATAHVTEGSPYLQPAHEAPIPILAVPGIMGVTQWALVAVVAASDGPTQAALVRIATSVASAPTAVVPLSGALILAYSRRAGAGAMLAKRTIGVAIFIAAFVAVGGSLLAPVFVDLLGHDAYAPLERYVPMLLAGGVGFTAVRMCWPLLVTNLIQPRGARALAGFLIVLCLLVIGAGWFGHRNGLFALASAYGTAGVIVAAATLRKLSPSRETTGSSSSNQDAMR